MTSQTPVVLLALTEFVTGRRGATLRADLGLVYERVPALMASLRKGDHELVGGTSLESILDALDEEEGWSDGHLQNRSIAFKALNAVGEDGEEFLNIERWAHGTQGFLVGLVFAWLAMREGGRP